MNQQEFPTEAQDTEVLKAAEEILEKYREAFEELAK